jgi:hypothetical protein
VDSELTQPHLEALEGRFNSDMAAIRAAAETARAAVDGDTDALKAFSGAGAARAPLDDFLGFGGEIPPLAASLGSEGALIPDTPLIDGPLANQSLAFDDAPLWQN